ncbi:hypothetical protein TTHT_1595 [Thermotomaculum hydrothermale]|uniref:DUF4412 domain-containing protein n=1 Tax=Thermotomaculum hydrothermale TaxID=981385 RepID=A0A7R6PI93_9BACT|nr:DUF4412 domain-containing protein [Thermotomaculum hydrothermale]BBB33084.1 hypothetical protein TTHT_1595 [Thermotomaculum hydrothermale]
MKRVFSILGIILLYATVSLAGVVYTSKVTTEITDPKVKEQMANSPYGDMSQPVTMKCYAENGKKFRVEIIEGGNTFTPKGTVVISSDGKMAYFLNPSKKTYWKMNLDELQKTGESAMKMMKKFAKMRYKDIYVNVVELGNGGKIAGYNTNKYKMLVKYAVEMKVLFKKIEHKHKEETEIYATKDFSISDFDVYSFNNTFSTGIPEVDAQVKLNVNKIGFPLKTVTYKYDENGKLQQITTFEILSLKKDSVSNSLFELPKGYTEEPSPFAKMMGGQGVNQGQSPDSENSPEEGKSKKKFNFKDLF